MGRPKLSAQPSAVETRAYYRRLRQELIAKAGGECVVCAKQGEQARAKDLEFHHLVYLADSVKDGHAMLRLFEVRKHPERFALVCKTHHLYYHASGARTPRDTGMSRRMAAARLWEGRRFRKVVIDGRVQEGDPFDAEEESDGQDRVDLMYALLSGSPVARIEAAYQVKKKSTIS